MTDSTLLKRGQGNGDGASVYICVNECQKRDELQKHQIGRTGRIRGKENGRRFKKKIKKMKMRRNKLNWKKIVSFWRNFPLSALKERHGIPPLCSHRVREDRHSVGRTP